MASYFAHGVNLLDKELLPRDLLGQVDVDKLTRIFVSTTSTYKFYFFLSLLDAVSEGRRAVSLEELMLRMLTKAWYPQLKFNLSFGSWDSFKNHTRAIKNDPLYLSQDLEAGSSESDLLKKFLTGLVVSAKPPVFNPTLKAIIKDLAKYVPSYFLTPWTGKDHKRAFEQIPNNAPYGIFSDNRFPILGMEVRLNPHYVPYFMAHYEILKNFTFFFLVSFLEKQNPQVPNIALKLAAPLKRSSLNQERRYFADFLLHEKVSCIYNDEPLTDPQSYDLDHFIPWSFTFSNTIWNLTPIDGTTNSQKSDKLPPFEKFISRLGEQHYALFHYHYAKGDLKLSKNARSNKITDDYLELGMSLEDLAALSLKDFTAVLRDHLGPAYQIAKNRGFELWIPVKAQYVREDTCQTASSAI